MPDLEGVTVFDGVTEDDELGDCDGVFVGVLLGVTVFVAVYEGVTDPVFDDEAVFVGVGLLDDV